ncbi:MAG: hypothetical protein WA885_17065 [Phormidesmis sp.]
MFNHLLPKSTEVQWIAEYFELHQAAQEFRIELARRQTEADYCQWYYEMAQQVQADVVAMENDVNFYGWFCGRKTQ